MRLSWWSAIVAAALVVIGVPASPAVRDAAADTKSTSTAASTASGGPQYRLPETAVPLNYVITLDLDKPAVDSFTGTVKISLQALRAVSFVTLHADQLAFKKTTFFSEAGKDLYNGTMETNDELQTVTLRLIEALVPGEKYTLSLGYERELRRDMYGFYRSTYKKANGTEVRLAATQFEPTYARSAFPCWDEPHHKATFKLTIGYPADKGWKALSNTPVIGDPETSSDGTTKFEQTPVMSSYLVAFVVSDFDYELGVVDASTTTVAPSLATLEYRVYVRPEQKSQGAAKYAAEVGPKLLGKLEEFTGIKYATMGLGKKPKLDLIAIPDFAAGAMENWGLITFRETGIMFTEGESTEASRESIALVIGHEQAHMWFGDLVSPAWWSCLWLNEGFARYLQYVSMDLVKSSWRVMDSFVVRTLQGALSYDALSSSRALTSEAYTPDEIQAKFDRISYDKGASVLHMTRNVIGDVNFRAALNKYLTDMKTWTAKPHDLFREFDARLNASDTASPPQPLPAGLSLTTVLETWTQQAGYPVVTIRSAGNGTANVTQVRFLSSGPVAAASCEGAQRWWVPLTYTLQDNDTVDTAWLDPKASTTLIPKPEDKWIIANVEQTGFYRVNYDDANWAALAKYLQGDNDAHLKVHVLNRAQVLDDALSLARAGVLAYPTALDTTKYLNLEKDPIPWTAALSHLGFLGKMLVGNEAQDKFKEYLLELMDGVYKDVGFDEPTAEADDDTKHLRLVFRATLMGQACGLGHKDCVGNATAKFKAFKPESTDKTNAVPPSLRSTVYCTGLREGSADDWEKMWTRYARTETSPGEKSLILGSLGCTRDNTLLNKYLTYSTDSTKVRSQDATSVFGAVLAGGDNLDLAFTFFKTNFKDMSNNYHGWSSMQKVVEGLADRVLTAEKLKELEDFLTTNSADLGVPQATVERSLETARANIAWRAKHLSSVADWVLGRDGGATAGTGMSPVVASPLVPAILALLALAQAGPGSWRA